MDLLLPLEVIFIPVLVCCVPTYSFFRCVCREPPRVLKPQDLSPAQNREWRPQIGMAPATQRASLGTAGHRMLG